MAKALDVRRAIRKALAEYLQGAGIDPDLVASEGWPSPASKLPPIALTVTIPDAPPDVEEHQPRLVEFTPTSANMGSALYSYGFARIGVQIDLWTQYEATRDDLLPFVRDALNRRPADTLGAPVLPYAVKRAPGLVLRLSDFYGALCSFRWDQLPRLPESGDVVQTGEWRAIWTGEALVYLLSQQSVAILKNLSAHIAINGGAPETVPLS